MLRRWSIPYFSEELSLYFFALIFSIQKLKSFFRGAAAFLLPTLGHRSRLYQGLSPWIPAYGATTSLNLKRAPLSYPSTDDIYFVTHCDSVWTTSRSRDVQLQLSWWLPSGRERAFLIQLCSTTSIRKLSTSWISQGPISWLFTTGKISMRH